MARIKGKYVATVEINFDFYSEENEEFLTFEEIKKELGIEITQNLLEVIQEKIMPNNIGTTEVRQQFVDCYRVEEDEE